MSRYYATGTTLKRLGIEWCNTEEYANFATAGALYDQQLGPDSGSSTAVKVYRSGA